MAEHQAEIDLQEQMEIAADAIRAAVLELLQAGRVHPHVLALALAPVAGELARLSYVTSIGKVFAVNQIVRLLAS